MALTSKRTYTPTVPANEIPANLPVMLNSAMCAQLAGVSPKHIRDLAHEGAIPGAVKLGTCWRFGRDAFLSWLGLR